MPEVECRLGILESYFKQILSYQDSIEKLLPDDASHDQMRSDIEDLYVSTKSKILALMSKNRSSIAETSTSFTLPQFTQTNLPEIQLPVFSGDYTEYTSFITKFKVLVDDNPRLSAVEKFRHLQACLRYKAKSAIGEMEITSANYEKALSSLDQRFNVKTLIFESHFAKIFGQPKVSKGSASQLRNLIDEIITNMDALKSIGSETEILDSILIYVASERLYGESISKWEEGRELDNLPKWADFVKVLNRRCQFLEARSSKASEESSASLRNQYRNNDRRKGRYKEVSQSSLTATIPTQSNCAICNKPGHYVYNCSKFLALSVIERYNTVKRPALCINCLAKGHSMKNCKSSKCGVCAEPHNTLLHRFTASAEPSSVASTLTAAIEQPIANQGSGSSLLSSLQSNRPESFNNSGSGIVLAIALVEIKDQSGCYHTARALLDSASQVNFITESMVQKLHLKKNRFNGTIGGVGDSSARVKFTTNTVFKSRLNSYQKDLHLWILPTITSIQPEQQIRVENWNIPANVQLADPHFYQPQTIDLLIGAEIFFELLSVGQIKLTKDLPILQKSQLGWIVSGSYETTNNYDKICTLLSNNPAIDNRLEDLVERLWTIEEVSGERTFWTEEQVRCEEFFLLTTRRDKDGRFIVKLPFKQPGSVLGHSYDIAKRRFLSLERRLNRSPELKAQYSEFLHEYEELNHMERIPSDEISSIKYVVPHQCVVKADSSSTKLRVVFDAGCLTTSNISLNEILMVGPTVQKDLFSIVFRWRFHKFALTADIVKMYRQIKIDSDDAHYQCIIWGDDPQEDIQAFRLTTVTYGTSPAPFLATRCLNCLVDEFIDIYPQAARIIKQDFYVDNLNSGGDSLEEIKEIQCNVERVLSSAQMELRKWYSNHDVFLEEIPKNKREQLLRINDPDVIKTLGLMWDPVEDKFHFVVPSSIPTTKTTKRTVLSDLAKLFDPLGLINPVVVKGKIFLQELWKLKLDWDESLPMELHSQWESFQTQLRTLGELRVPRFVLSPQRVANVQLYGFGDASMKCYGCCIYLRVTDAQGQTIVTLLPYVRNPK